MGRFEGNFLGSPTVSYIPRSVSLVNKSKDLVRINQDIGSAGSISLIIQALLPYFIFQPHSTLLILSGGTNVNFSPPIDHVEFVLLPLLSRMGIDAHISPNFKRGFYPFGGGRIELNIRGVTSIQPLICLEQGKIQSIECVIFGSEYESMEQLKESLKVLLEHNILSYLNTQNGVFADHFEGFQFHIPSSSSSSNQKNSQKKNEKRKSNRRDVSLGVQIIIRTTTGNILSADSLRCEKDPNLIPTFPESITSEIVNKIRHLIESGCCVDEQTADQLLIYLALATHHIEQKIDSSDNVDNSQGIYSQLLCEPFTEGQSSLHLETTITLLNQILGSRGCNIRMETDPNTRCRLITCQGINFIPS